MFNVHSPIDINLLTRLRLGLSHLNERRYNHKFKNCVSPKCICSSEKSQHLNFSCIVVIFIFQLEIIA